MARTGRICYTAAEIRKAYDYPVHVDGTGTSIAIVVAYGSPTVQSDLDKFSADMGIPSATVHTYCPEGCPSLYRANQWKFYGWMAETSLDVQWAHAMAPGAQINLVVAPSSMGNPMDLSVRYAVAHHLGDVITMSFGAEENSIGGQGNNIQVRQFEKTFALASAEHISLVASSGDWGTSGGALYPSSSPLVTAVGGTNLYTTDSGAYVRESIWGDAFDCPVGCALGAVGATGGAPSKIFAAPAYQRGVTGYSARTTSDVGYEGGVYTGALTYLGFFKNPVMNGYYIAGGASVGTPQWSAIAALAVEQAGHDLGQLNPSLYAIYANSAEYAADFHDPTTGNNTFGGAPGYSGQVGYDLPTGIGTPIVANLLKDLAGN